LPQSFLKLYSLDVRVSTSVYDETMKHRRRIWIRNELVRRPHFWCRRKCSRSHDNLSNDVTVACRLLPIPDWLECTSCMTPTQREESKNLEIKRATVEVVANSGGISRDTDNDIDNESTALCSYRQIIHPTRTLRCASAAFCHGDLFSKRTYQLARTYIWRKTDVRQSYLLHYSCGRIVLGRCVESLATLRSNVTFCSTTSQLYSLCQVTCIQTSPCVTSRY